MVRSAFGYWCQCPTNVNHLGADSRRMAQNQHPRGARHRRSRRPEFRPGEPVRVSRTLAYFLSIVLAYLLPVSTHGQATSGTILGYVEDPSGSRVPGAEVTAINAATGLSFTSRTGDPGAFALYDLPPGSYQLQVKKAGFKTLSRAGLELHVDQQLRVDAVLELGQYTETLSVSRASPVLQDQSAETGQVLSSGQILDLPLLERNLFDLSLLIPGVVSGAGGNISNYSVSGQREFSNSISLNGAEITGNRNNDTNLRPSLESIEEMKVVTSTYAPEFGRSGAGVIDVQTRSGSNAFHGSLFEFLRTNQTTARTFFAAQPSGLKENDFGATLGGPVRKSRTFFFASYEAKRQRNLFSYLDTTVPAGMIKVLPNGGVDLSGLRDPLTGKEIPIFDPAFYNANYYAEQFPGNVIPADRVSHAGLQVLQKLFAAPNAPGIMNGWFNNYQVSQRY